MNIFHKGNSDLTNAIVRSDWEAVKVECEAHPKSATVWSTRVGFFDGEHESHVLPIHSAAALCAPKDAIEALALANPDGVKAKETSFKRLPLHIACQSHAPEDVVSTLLSFYPQGAADTDVIGRLPLHYACSNGASVEVVEELLAAHPWSASGEDIHGWLPIHVACHFGASTCVIRALTNANPDSIEARTEKGSTPMTLIKKINCKNKEEVLHVLEDAAWLHWHGPMRHHPVHSDRGHDLGLHHRIVRSGAHPQVHH